MLGVIEDYTDLNLTEDMLNNIDNVEKSESDKPIKRTKKK
jgi:hypothetical protein